MRIGTMLVCGCLGLSVVLSGCANTPERVYYYGPRFQKARSCEVTKSSAAQLRAAGYEQIGTIQSEPMTRSGRFEQEMDQEALIAALAPENSGELAVYYARLDEQTCKRAAQAGGSFIRLEEIKHTFPKLTPESAILLGTDFGKDVKHVTSVKVWSVWRAPETR